MAMNILKNTPTHAVVSFVTTSATAFVLDLSTLVLAGTQTEVAPVVNIKGIQYSIHNSHTANITRNGVVIWSLANAGIMKFDGFLDNRENVSDITVTFSNGGSVVLELIKTRGFGDTQHIPSV